MRFDANNYKGKYAMHCATEKEATIFLKYLDSIGRKWTSGKKYTDQTYFYEERENTTYAFNQGLYGGFDWFIKEGCKVLEFTDFEWDGYKAEEVVSDDELLNFIGGNYGTC